MLTARRPLLATLALCLASCSSQVDLPKGTSKGYTSARLVQRDPGLPAITDPTEQQVHRLIHDSLRRQFTARGIAWGGGSTDLIVAYLVLYQEPGMTARYDDYFGYGRQAQEITNLAHQRGTVESKRPDYFQRGAILVDVLDARTNKLVFRNYAGGDVVRGVAPGARAARIDAAVARALAPFFR